MEHKTIAYNPGEIMSKEFAIEALMDIKRANRRMFLIENSKLFTDTADFTAAQQILDGIIELIKKVPEAAERKSDMELLANFAESIQVYGGIQKLFEHLNEVSDEYADELEKVYTNAILNVVKGN